MGRNHSPRLSAMIGALALGLAAAGCSDGSPVAPSTALDTGPVAPGFPDHATLRAALRSVVAESNGGLGLDMWAAFVDRTGEVVAVAFSGSEPGDQWPGSRVIAAQKANTANAFSLRQLALSTANLYAPTQPGGSLFGLQESNPVDADVAYQGPAALWGTPHDPLVGKRIGGINVFGGGLALYAPDGVLLGALGVSGDTSCADHNIAWKLRDRIGLDFVPKGVSPTGDDNIIYDFDPATGTSPSGFGHPQCSPAATAIGKALPQTNPIGGRP